jgi:hypothetical protein
MNHTINQELRKCQGHGRLLQIVKLMDVFSDKNAEKIYDGLDSIDQYFASNTMISQYIEEVINPQNYSSSKVQPKIEDLKVRGDIITKELIDYFGQIKENASLRHYQLPSNKLTVKPKDLIDRINDTIKFNSVILVKKY